jgi:hypothetical protein
MRISKVEHSILCPWNSYCIQAGKASICHTQREEGLRESKGSTDYFCGIDLTTAKMQGLLYLLLFHDDGGHGQYKLMTSTLTNVDRRYCGPFYCHFWCS